MQWQQSAPAIETGIQLGELPRPRPRQAARWRRRLRWIDRAQRLRDLRAIKRLRKEGITWPIERGEQ